MTSDQNRWPKSVYETGSEPDPRFTLANERTFLAWIRSAIAVIAIGVAINELGIGGNATLRAVVVAALIITGILIAVFSFVRWAKIEKAMRHSKPLPSLASGIGFAIAVAAIALLVALLTIA